MSLDQISSEFTAKTLDEIIQKAGGTKHTSYKFGKGFNKGDSYLSKVYRLCVYGVNEKNGSTHEVNLIVKAMPDNAARRELFRSTTFFRNEIHFYTKVVSMWEEFQKRRKPKNPFNSYPKCYACLCDGEHDFIALENVSFSGYETPKREEYISLDDCMLTMKTLGRFHGISLALKALEPENFAKTANGVEETYYSKELRGWYIGVLKLACDVAKDAVAKTYPDSEYEVKTNKFLEPEALYDELIHLVSMQSKYSVIGHGDCWTPNFLTRYNTETNISESIKIIDFQLARHGSPVLDLSFFIYSCTSEELRAQHYDEWLKAYHASACELINDLGADADAVYPWAEFQKELCEFARFGCGMGIESLPITLIEESEVVDLDEIQPTNVLTDIWTIKPFKEAAKRERIAQMFKHAIDHGYIV